MLNKQIDKYKNITLRPFVYTTPSMQTISIFLLVFLLPQVLMLFITKSFASLLILFAAVLGALCSECLFNVVSRTFVFSWLISLVQGIVLGLLLPAQFSPFAVFFITFTSMLVCKYSFGGFADSWINTVAITVAVAYFLNSQAFPEYLLTANDLQTKNTSLLFIQRDSFNLIAQDSSITNFLNTTFFSRLGIEIPEGFVTLFWDTGSSIPAFRFNFITLITSLVLFSFELIDMLIPLIFMGIYLLLVRFAPMLFASNIAARGDVLLAMLTSGTLFSTLFLLQWYGTTPVSTFGKIVYAVAAGNFAFLILGCGTSPSGYVFLVLIMNIISTMIQVVEQRVVRRKVSNVLMARVNSIKGGL